MKTWLIFILTFSFIFLAVIKSHQVASLTPFFKADKAIKLGSFEKAKTQIEKEDLDLLELWESVLTGRSAPLSRIIKEKYKVLGLNHIFTPSGFHLSAAIFPFMKMIKSRNSQLIFLLIIGCGLVFLPGFGALKRMVLIKTNQKFLTLHFGFISALLLDMFFGSFQLSPLSFTYSFLFIGIIYSGFRGLGLIVWFFLAQMLIAYFQGNDISLLLLIFSPLLNLLFTLLLPILLFLSFPLWDWQLQTGIFLLRGIQKIVDVCAEISFLFPTLEVNIMIFCILILFYFHRRKSVLFLILLFCTTLNPDTAKIPSSGSFEMKPQGKVLKTIYRETDVNVYFSDGKCRMNLVRGYWFENCSPLRRSSMRKFL